MLLIQGILVTLFILIPIFASAQNERCLGCHGEPGFVVENEGV